MSDGTRYTVDAVRAWNFSGARSVIDHIDAKGSAVKRTADATARDYDSSTDFWQSQGGDAARNLSMLHTSDLVRSTVVMETIAERASSKLDEIQGHIDVLNAKVGEIKASEYQLAYRPNGEVYSLRSNAEWADEWGWKTPFKLADKEGEELGFTLALRNALAQIQTIDQAGAETIRGTFESLAQGVKEGAVPMPGDPRLQEILTRYQTHKSSGQATLWPDGTLLATIRAVHPDFDPRLMTPEEVASLGLLLARQGASPIAQGEAVYRWYDAMSKADQVAKDRFPPNSLNDGHGDAFRHAYWNALLTKQFGAEWTAQYTTAHEGLGGNPANREAMDLYNNEIGRHVAQANPDASADELADLIAAEVRDGGTVVIGQDGAIDWSNHVETGDIGLPGTVGVPLPAH
ncbi:DUF6973 domain-containing protein [Gordonia insulae]|uniref:DUF6973 domain-containing protein n=1 Tax=Gordonia insulae TaxID=2420509 RepID=A0A3G8JIF1_9ACTN|nr:hypothetical protein [Gordonia insulae]AZG44282.1 hypothetical protein D7316_00866 [Gordonia insulae]